MIIATEGRGKKLAMITEYFSTYMDPLYRVSKGKTGEGETGKSYYRHCCWPIWRRGHPIHRLFKYFLTTH
jgi:hypothetical protein